MSAHPRALIYARISPANKDKNAPKVPAQIADCEALAARSGYRVVGIFQDDNESGSKGQTRDGWDGLLEAVLLGKADVILATEEERFSRNVTDKQNLTMACIATGTTWHTIRDLEVNPADAAGEFMSNIRAAVGRMESRRKAERQIDANTRRRLEGQRYMQGTRIFGWAADKVTVDPAEADLIRLGTKMILNGSSLYRVTAAWRESDVKPMKAATWQAPSIRRILSRWSNAAVMFHGDEPLEDGASGNWEAIVSRSDLEAVRTILRSTTGPSRNVAKYLASGIATCHCGSVLVGSGSKAGPCYVCTAQRSGTKVPGSIHAAIKADLLDVEITKAMTDVYRTSPDTESDDSANELAALYDKLAGIKALKVEAYEDRQSKAIDRATWTKVNASLTVQENDLQASIDKLATRSAHDAMLVQSRRKLVAEVGPDIKWTAGDSSLLRRGSHQVIEDIQAAFAGLDLEEQRALVRDRLDIVVSPGRGVERVQIQKRGNVPVQ